MKTLDWLDSLRKFSMKNLVEFPITSVNPEVALWPLERQDSKWDFHNASNNPSIEQKSNVFLSIEWWSTKKKEEKIIWNVELKFDRKSMD